jgi:hypothetical protein
MVRLATDEAGQQQRLCEGQKADRNRFVQDGVPEFVRFSQSPGRKDGFAGFVIHDHRAVVAKQKALRLDLMTIDEGKDEPVGDGGAELFHQVKRQRGLSGAVVVEESDVGIEADRFAGGAAIVEEKRVDEGKERIDAVQRGPTGSAGESEIIACGRRPEGVERCEVVFGGLAFAAPERIVVGSAPDGGNADAEPASGLA